MPTLDSGPTILALPAARLVAYAARHGVSPGSLLDGVDLAEPDLSDRERHLPIRGLYELWARVARRLGDPGVSFAVARAIQPEDYGVLGFALLTSATAGQALERLLRCSALITTSGRWSLRRIGKLVELSWARPAPLSLGVRLSNEAAIALAVQQMRASGFALAPVRVTFRHPRPPDRSAHADFFRCPVVFAQATDGFTFPAELLDAPPRLANAPMSEYFGRVVEHALDRFAPSSASSQVRGAIAASLASGPSSMAGVARQLALSERSLRRRLEEEGTGFRDLVEDVRRQQAAEWLKRTPATVSEIAYALGFSDATAFSRAYRRWFGVSPGQARSPGVSARPSSAVSLPRSDRTAWPDWFGVWPDPSWSAARRRG